MIFHSFDFAIFLPIVFIFYWLAKFNRQFQNFIIVIASLIFYGWWDWRFLWLILFTSFLDFFVGIALGKVTQSQRSRKILLTISIILNLSLLGFFKYFNFFLESFVQSFSFFGYSIPISQLNIVLPVGISFYTFQTMSYTIDVYRKQLAPTRDLVSFLAFVSFFPQLVAGPIERATNLLPQFQHNRSFSYHEARIGLRQILWGLFKKIAIADIMADLADKIFGNYQFGAGFILYVGALAFTIQIYADFSAYSDIAIGTARLFGFKLMQNFHSPYFAKSVREFWSRWHISLSTWFRDYIYIPLGGNRVSRLRYIRNIIIVFLLSGLWHGANWTFIAWGALHAVLFLPIGWLRLPSKQTNSTLDEEIKSNSIVKESLINIVKIIFTFHIILIGWVLFRSQTIDTAMIFLKRMLRTSLFILPSDFNAILTFNMKLSATLIIGMFIVEYLTRNQSFPLECLEKYVNLPTRWLIYLFLYIMIVITNVVEQNTNFIYFQF